MPTSYTPYLGLPMHDPQDPFDILLINEAERKTDAGMLAAAPNKAARNWLDNSSFLIDQRGKGTYTATGHSLDRWRFRAASGGSVTKLARGIRIDVGSGGLNGMYQRIANQDVSDKFRALAGKPVTLAVKITSNTLASGNCGIDLLDHTYATTEADGSIVIARKSIPNGETGIFVATGTMPEGITYTGITALFKTPSVANSGAVDIEWMALYEGTYTVDTLPGYVEPDYARELLECQRYYFRTGGQGWGYCTSATAARINVPIPVQMCALPSVDGDVTFTCHNNGSNLSVADFSPVAMEGASVRLNLTGTGFTKFTPLAGYASAAFGLSADLA